MADAARVLVTLLSPEGTPTAVAQIRNLSPGGVQLSLGLRFRRAGK